MAILSLFVWLEYVQVEKLDDSSAFDASWASEFDWISEVDVHSYLQSSNVSNKAYEPFDESS